MNPLDLLSSRTPVRQRGSRFTPLSSDGQEREELLQRLTPAAVAVAASGAALAAYRLAVRPWHRHWGTKPEELTRTLPGDELVPSARFRTTRAITIDVPPHAVWPWLVQMGQDRGGFYSYERLERLVGAEIRNVDMIHPEWQQLRVGDEVRLAPVERFGEEAKLTVARLEPERALVYGPPPATEADGSWAFVLQPTDGTKTRLIVRTQGRRESVPPFFFLFDLIHFIMERRMMLGIKERAEAHRAALQPVRTGTDR